MKTCQHQLEILSTRTSSQGMNSTSQSFYLDKIVFHLEPIVNEKQLESFRGKEKPSNVSTQKQVIVSASKGTSSRSQQGNVNSSFDFFVTVFPDIATATTTDDPAGSDKRKKSTSDDNRKKSKSNSQSIQQKKNSHQNLHRSSEYL